jgi:hypothetical protein
MRILDVGFLYFSARAIKLNDRDYQWSGGCFFRAGVVGCILQTIKNRGQTLVETEV